MPDQVIALGGQAAGRDIDNTTNITSLIGQVVGGSVFIQNLQIVTSQAGHKRGDAPAGLIAFFDLSGWWIESLNDDERGAVEDSIGDEVARDKISSTSRTAPSWLRSIALRISAAHPNLASKLRAKAAGIETGIEVDDYWQRQFDKVRKYWLCQNFEVAREELRAVNYRIREENALPEACSAYRELLTNLMHADPYFTEVMAVVLPIVASRPGVIQATLAKGYPEFDAERFRHAMYYGEIIGDIKRVKQGRSYGLFPVVASGS